MTTDKIIMTMCVTEISSTYDLYTRIYVQYSRTRQQRVYLTPPKKTLLDALKYIVEEMENLR